MRIGITGHQRLDEPDAWAWVERAIGDQLDRHPPPVEAVSSLAVGADQLLARIVLARGGTLHAVLPYAGLERSFAAADIPIYLELKARGSTEVLDTPGNDEDAYLAAGLRVADLSDVLIAVWNGRPAKGKGGTADVVRYALDHGRRLVHLNPVDRTVREYPAGEQLNP